MPKSSPVDRSFLSCARQTALMSVPSEPSGHTPKMSTDRALKTPETLGHTARGRPSSSQEDKTARSPWFPKPGPKERFVSAPSLSAIVSPFNASPSRRMGAAMAGFLGHHIFWGPFLTLQQRERQKPQFWTQSLSFIPKASERKATSLQPAVS